MVEERRPSDIVEEAFEGLRQSQVPEGPSMHALEQTLEAVHQAQQKSRRVSLMERIRNMNKFIKYPVAAAAAILLVVSLVFMNHTAPAASAAEALKQATTATSAYQGWIHVEQPQLGGSFHVDTRENTVAIVTSMNGMKTVEYLSPVKGEYLRYDARTNTITRNYGNAESTKRLANSAQRQFMPAGLIEDLSKYFQLKVTQGKKGNLDEFTVLIEGTTGRAKVTAPEKFVVLVNPQTSLTQEIQVTEKDKTVVTMRFSYGKPSIEGIYDLGVPKDARIVEAAPASQAATTKEESADIRFDGDQCVRPQPEG